MRLFDPGETAVLRGVVNNRVWLAQSTLVVKDTAAETILLLLPDAGCAYPEGYWRWRRGDLSAGNRWQEIKSNDLKLRQFGWLQNRFLIFMQPGRPYAIYAIWHHASDDFLGYYINFELPSQRSRIGFDTFDLELDIVIDPALNWRFKDEEEYQAGIQSGVIRPEWATAIDNAIPDALGMIKNCQAPLDGSWLGWCPPASWKPPSLPKNWMQISPSLD